MRIVAGRYGSRKIIAPNGIETRPTLDSVRESLFNILGRRCVDARVLDLFAGSGALGLEAISRGAKQAVFCEISHHAASAIRTNISSLELDASTRLLQMDWQAALRQLASEKAKFDIIFLDPPYKMPVGPIMEMIAAVFLLEKDTLFVVEYDRKAQFTVSDRFVIRDRRNYGDTALMFISPAQTSQEMEVGYGQ